MKSKPKILVFDIETAPIVGYVWGMYKQNLGLNQIKEDWHMIAWAAKWYGDPASKVMYMDNRNRKDIRNDKQLVKGLAKLLNQADLIMTQNGEQFDVRKVNARAVINGLPPIKHFTPSQSIDICKAEKKVFGYTSHKLEYKTEKINKKYRKLKHKEYPGFELWKAIKEGDHKAWDEMKEYNIYDVLSTEEHFDLVKGWIKIPSFAQYYDDSNLRCPCGSNKVIRKGFARTDAGKFQIYHCKDCGKWPRSAVNLLSKKKKKKKTTKIQSILRDGR